MNRFLRKAMALALAGTMTMGMNATAFAADGRDDASGFTEENTISGGIDSFYLIKDYDSINPTIANPYSSSPAETFVYEITPYQVWNAGSTYAGTDSTGAATKITKENMPMLTLSDGGNVTGEGATRKLTVNQKVEIGKAEYEGNTPDTANTTDEKIEIKLPQYTTVGDYWYKVQELNTAKTTGVLYGTNSNSVNGSDAGNITADNGNYSGIYYIHVQVTDSNKNTGTANLVKNVTMHKSAPNINFSNAEYNKNYAQVSSNDELYKPSNKVNAIENKYYAGELVIKKEVTGNAGDKNQYFEVTVKFTKPAGTVVNSDIPFTAVKKTTDNNQVDTYTSTDFVIKGQNSNESYANKGIIDWEDNQNSSNGTAEKTATCTFWVKDGTTVTFSNIPYGINYIIEETQPDKDTYTHKFSFGNTNDTVTGENELKFDGQGLTVDKATDETGDNNSTSVWSNAKAVGSITDANDTVTITNNKESAIDVGVITSNAPYVAVLIFAAAALVLYVRRRKDMFEE